MKTFVTTLAGAIGGAVLAVAIVFTLAQRGYLPINDRQMQTYLMLHPELAAAMMGRYQAQEDARQQAAQQAALSKEGQKAFFDPAIAFVTGPADAKKTMVEFFDYDCPYCRASQPAVQKYYEAHKDDTRFSFIEFPIQQLHGPGAVLAARASLAARRQPEHWVAYHFRMLGEQDALTEDMIYADAAKAGLDVAKLKADMKDPAIDKALTDSIALAHKSGIDGTPTFIMNGKLQPGAVDDESLADKMKS